MRVRPSIFILLSTAVALGACASKGPGAPGRGGPPPEHGAMMDPTEREEKMEKVYRQFVQRWDYNEDGEATCDDVNTQRSRLFRALDEDGNGELTSGEYRHAKFEDKSFMFFDFMRVDTNASGKVELEELIAVPHSQFLNADKNKDCSISRDEVMASIRETMMQRGDGGGNPGRGGRAGRRPPGSR